MEYPEQAVILLRNLRGTTARANKSNLIKHKISPDHVERREQICPTHRLDGAGRSVAIPHGPEQLNRKERRQMKSGTTGGRYMTHDKRVEHDRKDNNAEYDKWAKRAKYSARIRDKIHQAWNRTIANEGKR